MENCFLCLQFHTEYNTFICAQSSQWLKLKIINVIEKHFWPIDNSDLMYGICQTCWTQLYDFHTFYTTIEESHGKTVDIDIKDTCNLDMEMKVHEINPRLLKIESSTEECIFPNDGISEHFKIEENSLAFLPTITVSNDVESINTKIQKRKRGRPRKLRVINAAFKIKPERKRGRPRKYAIEKSDLHTNDETRTTYPIIVNMSNQSTIGVTSSRYIETPEIKTKKRGRPNKKLGGRPINTKMPKRKRGRPRKVRVINAAFKIKPKRKRGRPRKYDIEKSDLHINDGTRTTYPIIFNMSNQSSIGVTSSRYIETPEIKTKKRGLPNKEPRGRPRKMHLNETINITSATDEVEISRGETIFNTQSSIVQLNTDCPIVNLEKLSKDVPLNLYGKRKCKTNELEYKQKIQKKRKRIQQHKAIMRNYIATSVRCMKFLKKY